MRPVTVNQVLRHLNITRLAHFTPAKNLWHIMEDGQIRSSKDLAENAPEYFDPTDRERLDLHPEMVCCSLEYPNSYYLAKAKLRREFINYPEWVCLLLDPTLLLRPGTLFSGCNGAKEGGAYLALGGQALLDCYADPSIPAGYTRGPRHPRQVPTDLQAEAQVVGPVELSYLRGIVVPTADAALNLHGILNRGGFAPSRFVWSVAPDFFSTAALRGLRDGRLLVEQVWNPETGLKGVCWHD
jgi:hypothetical protein